MPIPFLVGAALSALGASAASVAAAGATAVGAAAAAGAAAAGTTAGLAAAGAIAAGTTAAYTVKKGLKTPNGIINEINTVKSIFTTDEATKVLGMSKPTILKKMKEGAIPYEGSGGRGGFRIRREALEAFAQKNNIVPNWGVEIPTVQIPSDKDEIEELIKLRQIQKEEAELNLEELKLDTDDSIEHKRDIVLAKKIVNYYEKEIQSYKILLKAAESKEDSSK